MHPIDPQAINELEGFLGQRLSSSETIRAAHASDASYHPPHAPQAVAFPQSVDELARIARVCTAHRVPIVPFGTGTAVEGGIVAVHGGLCIDLSQMNRILRTSTADIDSAVETAIEVLSQGIAVARLEFLDEVQMQASNQYSDLDYPVAPTLFFEFHGSDADVIEKAESAGRIVATRGGGPFRWATAPGERDRLWQARYDAYHASRALRPGSAGYVTDVCVPISALAPCIRQTRAALQDLPFPAPLFGHVGDGNFHVVCLIEPGSASELAQVQRLGETIVALALEAGGPCSGEHGIGLGKIAALEAESGTGVQIMRHIKQALDPDNLMNPGKVLRV